MFGFILGVIVCAIVIVVVLKREALAPIAAQLVVDAKEAIAKLRAGK